MVASEQAMLHSFNRDRLQMPDASMLVCAGCSQTAGTCGSS